MKRLLALCLILALAFSAGGCQPSGSKSAYEEPVILFVAGAGSVDDGSFNSSIIDGLKKAARDLKFDLKILQTDTEEQAAENLKVALAAEPAMIVGVTNHTDQMLVAAAEHPDIHFAVIDGMVAEDEASGLPANFVSMNFDNSEGAFLMGVLAASANEATTVEGFIGGMDIPVVRSAEIGYRAGVKAINPEGSVLSSDVGSFNDSERAGQTATEQNQQGAGVIFGFAGGSNAGIIESAAAGGYWFIGVDQDQAIVYPQFAPNILCSMVKNVDTAAYDAARMQMDGSFKGGVREYGVTGGGITLGSAGGNITAELQAVYDRWLAAIADGTVTVPQTQEELAAFSVNTPDNGDAEE